MSLSVMNYTTESSRRNEACVGRENVSIRDIHLNRKFKTGILGLTNASLHQLWHAGRTHVMRFIIAIEDDLAVPLEFGCDSCPPGFEARVIGDNISVVSTKVVGIDESICTFPSDVVYSAH